LATAQLRTPSFSTLGGRLPRPRRRSRLQLDSSCRQALPDRPRSADR
jgi:hypothetical protein